MTIKVVKRTARRAEVGNPKKNKYIQIGINGNHRAISREHLKNSIVLETSLWSKEI